MTYIYTLSDPRTAGVVRYVGKTKNPRNRLAQHVSHARKRSFHTCMWVRSLLSAGVRPLMTLIETVADDLWQEREKFWIRHYREQSADLTNLCEGGKGPGSPSEETRLRMSAASRGRRPSEEARRRMSESRRGKPAAPGTVARLINYNQTRTFSEETRAKIGAAQKGKTISAEQRRAVSDANRGKAKTEQWLAAQRHRFEAKREAAAVAEAQAKASGMTMKQMLEAGFSARAVGRVFGTNHHAVLAKCRSEA